MDTKKNEAITRRERLIHIIRERKFRESDKKDISDLLREPEMREKMRRLAERLFGGPRTVRQTADLMRGDISNAEQKQKVIKEVQNVKQ